MESLIQAWFFDALNAQQQSVCLKVAKKADSNTPIAYRQLYQRVRLWIFESEALGSAGQSPLTEFQLSTIELSGLTTDQLEFFLLPLQLVVSKHDNPHVIQQALLVRSDILEVLYGLQKVEMDALRQRDGEVAGVAKLNLDLVAANQKIRVLSGQIEDSKQALDQRDQVIARIEQDRINLRTTIEQLKKGPAGIQIALAPANFT